MTSIDDPERLRMRAADMRARADNAVHAEIKQGLLRIAGDFDVLATRAEQRLAMLRSAADKPEAPAGEDPASTQESNGQPAELPMESSTP
jgi:hypothetical protein